MEQRPLDKLSSIGYRLIKAETPPFWKKIRNIMITIGAVSGTLIATAATGGIALPAILLTIANYGVVIGVVGTTLSQATAK